MKNKPGPAGLILWRAGILLAGGYLLFFALRVILQHSPTPPSKSASPWFSPAASSSWLPSSGNRSYDARIARSYEE